MPLHVQGVYQQNYTNRHIRIAVTLLFYLMNTFVSLTSILKCSQDSFQISKGPNGHQIHYGERMRSRVAIIFFGY